MFNSSRTSSVFDPIFDRFEFEVIFDTSCKYELSSIQLVNIRHCTRFGLIEFECFEFSLAYMESQINVPLSYVDPRGPPPSGEGNRAYFSIASGVALVVDSHVWLGR